MSDKIYKSLIADFPAQAYAEDKTRGFSLTTLKAQYIRERLNEAVGIFGWELSGEYKDVSTGVIYLGRLTIRDGDTQTTRIVEAAGYGEYMQKKKEGNNWVERPKNMGDVYKAAQTDSLSKCASFVGVGNDMFKGLINPSGGGKSYSGGNSAPNSAYSGNPGDYVCQFGKKYKGQAIKDIIQHDLVSYCTYLSNTAKEKNEDLSGPAKELVDQARLYLKTKKVEK